jgi:hypothetical protein
VSSIYSATETDGSAALTIPLIWKLQRAVHLKPIFVALYFLYDKVQKKLYQDEHRNNNSEKAQKKQWQPTRRIFASEGYLRNCIAMLCHTPQNQRRPQQSVGAE